MSSAFIDTVKDQYSEGENTLCLGGILHQDQVLTEPRVNIALQVLNRHGLIAGATGTGKTKTIQMLSEQLAYLAVPSMLMDIKGDLSGLAMPGSSNDKIAQRQQSLQLDFIPSANTVEFLSLGEEAGVKMRSTVREFGPILFARMLGLNETQSSIISILFQYANDNNLLLLDLADIKQVLIYAQNEGRKAIEANYGGVSAASLKTILRKVIELESQGGDLLFGEPSFDVNDLSQLDSQGHGLISILRLMDVQDKPKLFSSFMLGLLTEVYSVYPEIGDPDKPKLVIFIDEAHLIFKNATPALLDKLESMVKLIRSKGVGLIFCTQSPKDIPEGILSQLGLKIQHALRAFTAKDRKAIKLIAENFPITEFYDTAEMLTSLGIGQAMVSALDKKGQPTPLVAAMLRAPVSRMGSLSSQEFSQLIRASHMVRKYATRLERESAMEVLKSRIETQRQQQQAAKEKPKAKSSAKRGAAQVSAIESISKNTLFRQVIRTITREVSRAVMAALGLKKSRRRKK